MCVHLSVCVYIHIYDTEHIWTLENNLLELVLTFHAILRLVLVSAHFPGLPDLLVLELTCDTPLHIPSVHGGVCITDVHHHI